MDFEKKYRYQKKHSEELSEIVSKLKKENEQLRGEIDFLKNYNTKSGDEAKRIIVAIESLQSEYNSVLDEIKKTKSKYEDAINLQSELRSGYCKSLKSMIRMVKKQLKKSGGD